MPTRSLSHCNDLNPTDVFTADGACWGEVINSIKTTILLKNGFFNKIISGGTPMHAFASTAISDSDDLTEFENRCIVMIRAICTALTPEDTKA